MFPGGGGVLYEALALKGAHAVTLYCITVTKYWDSHYFTVETLSCTSTDMIVTYGGIQAANTGHCESIREIATHLKSEERFFPLTPLWTVLVKRNESTRHTARDLTDASYAPVRRRTVGKFFHYPVKLVS